MKIIVHDCDEDTRDIRVIVPTGMIFNPVNAMIAAPVLRKKSPVPLRAADLIRFCNEINRMKRIHRNMPLVEVEDASGDTVKIYL